MKACKVSSYPVVVPVESEVEEEAAPPIDQEQGAFLSIQVRGAGSLYLGTASLKTKLQEKIEESLQEIFQLPQLVESLTDYLAETIHENPHGVLLEIVK